MQSIGPMLFAATLMIAGVAAAVTPVSAQTVPAVSAAR